MVKLFPYKRYKRNVYNPVKTGRIEIKYMSTALKNQSNNLNYTFEAKCPYIFLQAIFFLGLIANLDF